MKMIYLIIMLSGFQIACSSFVPARLDRAEIIAMQGTWYSKGYGYVYRLNREHLDLYTIAGSTCFKEDYSIAELAYDFPHYRRVSKTVLELGESPDDKTVQFEKIPSLPDACLAPASDDAVSVAIAFGDILQTHYPFFDLHRVDWSQRRAELESTVSKDTADEELAQKIFASMEGISDSHLGVLASINGERKGQSRRVLRNIDPMLKPVYESGSNGNSYNRFRRDWVAKQRSAVAAAVLGKDFHTVADNKLVWGKMGNTGYLQIKQFLEYANSDNESSELKQFANHIDLILTSLAGVDALIIDVSLSRGGYGSLGFELASRFVNASLPIASEGLLVHKHYKHNIGDSDMRSEFLFPSDRVIFDKPVFVIASEVTTSAAEEFLMAMRVQEHVVLIGAPSNGSLSDVLEKPLPNGWLMVLSHEVYLSPDNEVFEKVGVPVDIEVELFEGPNIEKSYQQGILSIVERVKRR